MYGCESWTIKKAERRRIDAFELWCWRRLLRESLDCKEVQSVHPKGDQSVLGVHWKDWCWSLNSNTLATWCEELIRPWYWERLRAGGEGDNRGWDGWMASPTISSFVVPFSSCLQSFPASGSFPISQLFASGGQSIGVLASTSVFPMNIQCWFILGWTVCILKDGLDLFEVQGILKHLLQHHSSKASILWLAAFFMVQLSHPFMTTRKTVALTIWTFVGKVMSLLFNILSRFVIAFLPRSKDLLIGGRYKGSHGVFFKYFCMF